MALSDDAELRKQIQLVEILVDLDDFTALEPRHDAVGKLSRSASSGDLPPSGVASGPVCVPLNCTWMQPHSPTPKLFSTSTWPSGNAWSIP